MTSCRVAVVAPYRELAELTQQVCEELNLQAMIGIGDLEEGIKVATDFVSEGIEVIISRGGTATAIAEALEVPVVQIAVSAFDLIRAIAQAKFFGSNIGVVGYRNVIYGCKSLESVLGIFIQEIQVEQPEQVDEAITTAITKGVQVIVGDAVTVRCSKEKGLPALLVNSGREAIGIALREAYDLSLVRSKDRARAEQLRVILDATYEGIIATDAEGRIALVNTSAQKILGLQKNSLMGEPVEKVLPGYGIERVQQTGIPQFGEVQKNGGSLIVQNFQPVNVDQSTVGVVATFQYASHLQAVEAKVRQKIYLKGHIAQTTFSEIATQSQNFIEVIHRARQYAATESTVLILGETGTGKELIAQSIHNASTRREQPFVAINCAALPEHLLESELFGYEEGAFTGARKGGKQGLFEIAHRGTLFLDEVGELSLSLQARLLRVLQQKAIMRVGGDRLFPVDVRIIAATHRDLERAIIEEKFRRDLYYRLNVLQIKLPPLRDRLTDFPLLLKVLVYKITQRTNSLPPIFNEEIISRLKAYSWPGNVRELENVLERLVVLRSGQPVESGDLLEVVDNLEKTPSFRITLDLQGTLADMQDEIIQKTLELTHQDKDKTCQILGLSKTTLWRRMKDHLDISI